LQVNLIMSMRSWMRSIEKQWLRPLGRRLRFPRFGRRSRRLADLETRVEELESLVRELAGLAYLQLDDGARPAKGSIDPPESREAA
jgi:hypothetical protein